MQKDLSYGDDYHYIPESSMYSGIGLEVLPDLYCHTVQIANISFVGNPEAKDFVLVDAGMPESANEVITAAEKRFGTNSRPKAIILTHGHFDHVGAVIELVNHWEVPVYAHELEMPFLTGKQDYPEPDPTVEGGLVAEMSSTFPNKSINLGDYIKLLPADGSVPEMAGWRWVHTPGHTPGHISLFRDEDHSLIAGDAFVTVKQDALDKVLTQEVEVNGPPRYLTPDWDGARDSVKKLYELEPRVAVTGHGKPLSGEGLINGLESLVNAFDQMAIPDYGMYVNQTKH